MADAMSLAKLPSEKLSAFNKRLKQACDDQPVTGAQILVIDGQPVGTIFSEIVEAEQEDVDEGVAEKVGEEIPAKPPVIVQVARARCDTDEGAVKTQEHLETLFSRANGEVVEILHGQGSVSGWVEGPDKKQAYVSTPVTFLLVSYIQDEDDAADGDDGEAEQNLESRLRRPATAEKT